MDELARYLREHGKTQRWLAEQVGVREQAVTAWMRGRFKPRLAQIQKITAVTGGAVTAEAWFDRLPAGPVGPEAPQEERDEEDQVAGDESDRVEQNPPLAVEHQPDRAQHPQDEGSAAGEVKGLAEHRSYPFPTVAAE